MCQLWQWQRDHDALTLEQIQSFEELMKRAGDLAPRNGSESKEFDETLGQLCQMMEHHIQQFESSEADVAEHPPAAAAATSGAVLDPSEAAIAALQAYFIGGPAAANAALGAIIGRGQR
jgi:hypothetical protein